MKEAYWIHAECTCGGTVQVVETGDGIREIMHEWTTAHEGPGHDVASIGWERVRDDGATGAASTQGTD
jgi:hypothetical protein